MDRYEAYKDSGVEWIGEIPVGWSVIDMRRCITRTGNGLTRRGHHDESGTWVLRLRNIGDGIIESSFQSRMILTDQELSTFKLDPGDFLFVRVNGSRDLVGKSAVFEGLAEDVAYNDHIIRIQFDDQRCFPQFALRYLQSDAYRREIDLRIKTSAGQFTVSSDDIKECRFVMPPLTEQQTIADFLDAKTAEIDTLVADCEREVELLREYRKAVISEAVTKGLDPNVPMKDSGIEWIGEIPAGWTISKIKHLFINRDYARIPIESSKRDQSADVLYPYYGASGIVDYISEYIFDEDLLLIGEDGANLRLRNLPLIYAASGKYWVNNHAHILQPRDGIEYKYAFYQLELVDLEDYLTGSTQPKLTAENLGRIPLVIPPPAKQREIASYLDAKTAEMDSLIDAKRQMIEKLREYRKSLISEAVTGKFKVPGA